MIKLDMKIKVKIKNKNKENITESKRTIDNSTRKSDGLMDQKSV